MGCWIWCARWIIFCSRHSRLSWVHYQKYETEASNPPVQMFVNRIQNRVVFIIKTCSKLELLSPETMKLLGSIKKDD